MGHGLWVTGYGLGLWVRVMGYGSGLWVRVRIRIRIKS